MLIRNAKEIGVFVRERRLKLKLSQAELSQRVGVSRLWIVLLEKGKPTAQLGLVLRTLNALGLSLKISESTGSLQPGKIDLDKLLRQRTGKGVL
ncbi:MAG: helix-turn-helix transcriptional regulator [Blastochloris sp.]|nr:helix-turn-helix transcriptional regulator [Blastochloris sp.]